MIDIMSDDLLFIGIIFVVIVAGFILMPPLRSEKTWTLPIFGTEAPPPTHFAKESVSPKPTFVITVAPPVIAPPITTVPPTTGPPIEYVDISLGGSFGPNSNIFFPEFGLKGTISSGEIVDGNIVTPFLIVKDKDGQNLIEYKQTDHYTYGHLELISKPKIGMVVMKVNGNNTDVCLKYADDVGFYDYVNVVLESETVSSEMMSKLSC